MELKRQVVINKENDYQAPSDIFPLVQEMIHNIGSLDAQLRDELIYTTLSNWIPAHALTVYELEQILPVVLDENHLHFRLGDTNSDAVFTRSFSMLVISLFYPDIENHHFSQRTHSSDQRERILQCTKERDYRGYDEVKGWAHAIAHAADVLDDLAQCTELDETDLLTILDLVYQKDNRYRLRILRWGR